VARQKDAFLVNLWFESRGLGEPQSTEWRGSVEHLMTQQRRYFTEIVDLVTFLTEFTGKAASTVASRLPEVGADSDSTAQRGSES
jgi:hypothetical protein